MATIETRRNKSGDITSYRIVVCAGYDSKGTKILRRKTWKPDPQKTQRQNEKALQKAAALFEQSVEQGYQLDNNQTFEEYAQYVIELKSRNGIKPRTIDRYNDLMTRITPAIGTLKLIDIRPQHLNDFYSSLMKSGIRKDNKRAIAKDSLRQVINEKGFTKSYVASTAGVGDTTLRGMLKGKPVREATAIAVAKVLDVKLQSLFSIVEDTRPLATKTVFEYHQLISTILENAEKELLVPYNAAEKASPPSLKKKSPNYFQPKVVTDILNALATEPLKWQLVTILLISTGCRRGEIMGLKWEKINFETNQVLINSALLYTKSKGVYEETTKTEDVRWLKLPEETMALLRRYRMEQRCQRLEFGSAWVETDYVFTRDNGERMHPDSATDWLAEFSKRHNLPHVNPHAFRHTAASVLISNGIDIVTVSKQLGHASVSTTENYYSHIIDETKAKASECIAEVLLRRQA